MTSFLLDKKLLFDDVYMGLQTQDAPLPNPLYLAAPSPRICSCFFVAISLWITADGRKEINTTVLMKQVDVI
jgi:hypothetical protein